MASTSIIIPRSARGATPSAVDAGCGPGCKDDGLGRVDAPGLRKAQLILPGPRVYLSLVHGGPFLRGENRSIASTTNLIMPVPDAEPLVGEWRMQLDPAAAQGVPAHITVLGPFVPHEAISAKDIERLRALFAATPSFPFVLAEVGAFPDVVYLGPQPAAPFVELTKAVWRRWPDHPPYEGVYDEIVPHLTVAVGEPHLDDLRQTLKSGLPVATVAREVWLIVRDEQQRWRCTESFPFGRRAGTQP